VQFIGAGLGFGVNLGRTGLWWTRIVSCSFFKRERQAEAGGGGRGRGGAPRAFPHRQDEAAAGGAGVPGPCRRRVLVVGEDDGPLPMRYGLHFVSSYWAAVFILVLLASCKFNSKETSSWKKSKVICTVLLLSQLRSTRFLVQCTLKLGNHTANQTKFRRVDSLINQLFVQDTERVLPPAARQQLLSTVSI
jgi:hypothetical protein